MPRNARCVLPGVAYHVTQRGTNRQNVFFRIGDYRTYLQLLGMNIRDCGVRVLAWCLMPNHVHLVVVPEHEDSMAKLLRRVNGRYAQYLNAKRNRTGHLWQNRFFSCALSETHLWSALRYVEKNPVRSNLESKPADYRWSSADAHLSGVDHYGILDIDFWARTGGRERWMDLLATPDELADVRWLQACTYAGQPFGEEAFVAQFEQRFQRKWRRLPAGRQIQAAAEATG